MDVTIKQIAELAGVSRGTVDKVLNGRPGVKPDTQERILQIVAELDYKPNYLGKALVRSKEKLKIGVILTPEYNPFVHEIIHGIHTAQDEFKLFGLDVTIKMLSSLEPAEQIGILNYFENENYSGVAVFPINDDQVIRKINSMQENGIAMITFNSQVQSINDICFVGQNHYKGGRAAAGLMNKLLPDGGDIGIIISSMNLSCHQDRLQGFQEKIAEEPRKLSIVQIQENQDRSDLAFKIAFTYINTAPNLKGIYLTGGGAAGIGKALDLTNKNSKIKVICHDLVSDTIELIKKGTVDFILGQNPERQGYLLIKTLFEYLIKHQSPKSRIIDIPIEIFTADTVE